MIREQIIREVDDFLYESEIPPAIFGRDALGDSNFVGELRQGRDLRVSTIERLRDQMEYYRRHGRFRRPRPRAA